jgi:hypothetical protein
MRVHLLSSLPRRQNSLGPQHHGRVSVPTLGSGQIEHQVEQLLLLALDSLFGLAFDRVQHPSQGCAELSDGLVNAVADPGPVATSSFGVPLRSSW